MNKLELTRAGIDVAEGINRMNGMQALYEKFLYRFPTDENYNALLNAMAADDVEAAFRAGHALKGLAGNLSINRLYHDLRPLVDALRSGELAAARQHLPAVQADYDAVLAALTAKTAG